MQREELKASPLYPIVSRPVVTLYISGFLVLMNLMVSLTLFPLYIRFRGGSDFMIGLQSSIFAVASVILRLYFGPLADSVGRRFPLVLGAGVFATAPLFVWLSPNFFIMSLARIYQAVGMGTFLSAASSSVADMVPPSVRGTALGIYRASVSSAIMVGPLIGYRLIEDFGYPGLFIGLSATSATALLLLLTVPFSRDAAVQRIKRVTVQALLGLFRIPVLAGCYLGIFFTSIASGIVLTYTAVYIESVSSIFSPAVFFAVFAASGIVCSPFSGYLSDRFGRGAVVFPLIMLFAFGLVLLGIERLFSSWALFVAAAVAGIGYSGSLAVFIPWIVDKAPAGLRASALAFEESSIDIGNAAGIFLFGLLASAMSYSSLYLSLGVFTALSAFTIIPFVKNR